jgi:hypothetical protein
VIKREKDAETPQGRGRRSSYSQTIKKAVRRVEEYERSLKNTNTEKGEASMGKIRSKIKRLINIYNKVREKYKIPDLGELNSHDIEKFIYNIARIKRGSEEKAAYFKTIVRRIIMISCVRGLFPIFTTSNEGEIISIRHIMSELEELSKSGKDRRVTNLCVRGKSCLKRIFREIGAVLTDDLLGKIALTSARYSSIRFDLVMETLKISFANNRDEIDVLNELSSDHPA